MIQNIIVLLLANTFIPLLPIPPEAALPIPLLHYMARQPSVYEHMNLSRIHTPQQFKKSFRDSLKTLHPDKGGDQVAFSKVKSLKKIMEQKVNYYDTLNITDVDLEYNIEFAQVVNVKTATYFVEAGVYYFIVLLYVLAYTIDDDTKPARKILLPMIILFAAYELFIHYNPQMMTIFDLLNNKIPIFAQKALLKTMLSTFIAIVRAKFSKKVTEEKRLIKIIKEEDHTEVEYRDALKVLCKMYQDKTVAKKKSEASFGTRVRGWVSKAFTLFVIYSLIKGFFPGSDQEL